jgi:hypothetical protein
MVGMCEWQVNEYESDLLRMGFVLWVAPPSFALFAKEGGDFDFSEIR